MMSCFEKNGIQSQTKDWVVGIPLPLWPGLLYMDIPQGREEGGILAGGLCCCWRWHDTW